MAGDLQIVVTADTGNATTQLDKLDDLLQTLSKDSYAAAAGLGSTASAADKAGRSVSNVRSPSKTAGAALNDLSRVVQDLPFGFVAISNNLNPLFESFSRLRAEATLTGVSLKKLVAQQLASAGGIGIALAVVSSALTLFQIGFGAITRGFSRSKAAIDANAKATKEAADEYNSIVQSIAKEVGQVEVLINALNNENLSRRQRINVIKELQKISPEYFSSLNTEKATIEQIAKAYDAYSRAITGAIELKVREGQLDKVIEKRLALQDKANKLTSQSVDINGKLIKTQNAIYDEDATGAPKQFRNILLTQKETGELNTLLGTEKQLLAEIGLLSKGTTSNLGSKTKEDVENINDVLAKLQRELNLLSTRELLFKTDETEAKIKEIQQAIEKLVVKFKIDPKDTLIRKLFGDIQDLEYPKILDKIRQLTKNGINSGFNLFDEDKLTQDLIHALEGLAKKTSGLNPNFGIEIPVSLSTAGFGDAQQADFVKQLKDLGITEGVQDGINVAVSALRFPELKDLLDSAKGRFADFNRFLTEEIQKVALDLFSALGDGIAAALTGSNIGEVFTNFFKSALGAIGDGLRELGIAGLATTKLILALKKTLGTSLGVGASIALIVLGAVIKAAASNIQAPKFATGVSNFRGGTAIVGERGPELVRLPTGSNVIPNGQLNALGNQSIQVFGNIVAKGNDLLVVFDRAVKTRNRNS